MSALEVVPGIDPLGLSDDGDIYEPGPATCSIAQREDKLPSMVAEGGTPTDKEALEAALASGPIMAGDFWDLEMTIEKPVYMPVQGSDLPLVYRGKSHAFMGEPGRGKSMIAQMLHVTEAQQGRCSLFIDLEKSFPDFRARIRALGATRETAGLIGYWRANGALSSTALAAIAAFAKQWGVEVVTIDSVGRALSRAGLIENDNDHVRSWYDRVADPMVAAGLTPILIDHVKKPGETGGRPGGASPASRYAKGAGAKLDVITGAAYGIEFVTPFSQHKPGLAKIITAKDNNGARHEGEVAAQVHVTPSDGGAKIDMLLKAPPESVSADGKSRPTAYMEKVSRLLETVAEPLSISRIKKEVGGKSEWVGVAVERLADEGFVSSAPGARNAKLISGVKVFRAEDEGADDSTTNPF